MFQDFALNFDASQFDPRQSEGGVCLPLADYPMEITNIAQVASKNDAAKGFIEISLTVLDGQYKGSVQKDRLNVYGQEAEVTRMGYQRLSAYAYVAGKLTLPNAGALLGTKLIARCGPQDPPNEKYSQVKMVMDVAGNPPVQGQQPAPQPQQGQPFGQTQQAQPTTAQPTQTFGQSAAQPAAQGGWNNPAQQPQTIQSNVPVGAATGGKPSWAQ